MNNIVFAMTSRKTQKLLTENMVFIRKTIKNWGQKKTSERSNVSYGSLQRFEQTSDISLENFLKLVAVYDYQLLNKMNSVFDDKINEYLASHLDIKEKQRGSNNEG